MAVDRLLPTQEAEDLLALTRGMVIGRHFAR
jgi:hypothetical protein